MKWTISAALAGLAMNGVAMAQPAESVLALTRDAAIERAVNSDPSLAAASEGVKAAEALGWQASLRPNPHLTVEMENIAGSGPYSGIERAETTFALTQQIELGGDRHARRRIAEEDARAARLRAGLTGLDLREAVELAFVEAQASSASLDIARERLTVARRFASAVGERVRAARDSEAASARVTARLAETESEADAAATRARAARAALASYWGGTANFTVETGSFFKAAPRVAGNGSAPEVALAEARRDRADARLALEQAERVPDLDVKAGWRQFQDDDASAFVLGVTLPLPIWNRNSGSIAAARAERTMAEYEVAARERALARDIALLESEAEASRAEIEAFKTRIISSSQDALDRSLSAYRRGGVSYVEVLDAQRSLTDARLRQIAALRAYHRAQAMLARRRGDALSQGSNR